MALYKITSALTTSIDFADRSVGVPSTSELSDEEAAIASQVADLVKVSEKLAAEEKVDEVLVVLAKDEYPVNKTQEKEINSKLDYDQK